LKATVEFEYRGEKKTKEFVLEIYGESVTKGQYAVIGVKGGNLSSSDKK